MILGCGSKKENKNVEPSYKGMYINDCSTECKVEYREDYLLKIKFSNPNEFDIFSVVINDIEYLSYGSGRFEINDDKEIITIAFDANAIEEKTFTLKSFKYKDKDNKTIEVDIEDVTIVANVVNEVIDFFGTYVVEETFEQDLNVINMDTLTDMKHSGLSYLVFVSEEGSSSSAMLRVSVRNHVRKFGTKIYEVNLRDARRVFGELDYQYAPLVLLVSGGNIVAKLEEPYLTNATTSGDYRVIYNNFTKNIISETRR